MTETEKESLYLRKDRYVSIGITENGSPAGTIGVPWEVTAHAFNMKIPDVYIAPEDLNDEALMDKISSFHVTGCYVFTPLGDYGFIGKFKDIMDIYIVRGGNLKDLSFLCGLGDWMMLHVEGAHLDDLEPISLSLKSRKSIPPICLSFSCCTVGNISALYGLDHISELIITGADDNAETARWSKVCAHTFKYRKTSCQ